MPWDLIDPRRDEDAYPASVKNLPTEERIRIARRIRDSKGR